MAAKRLSLDEVESGMVLALDVCDAGGGCLLAQGAELSESTIASLRRRGLDYVMVLVEEHLTEAQRAARDAETRQRIDWLFRKAGNDPMLLKLHAMMLQYRLSGRS